MKNTTKYTKCFLLSEREKLSLFQERLLLTFDLSICLTLFHFHAIVFQFGWEKVWRAPH